MPDIVLRNGWNDPAVYKGVASVSFATKEEDGTTGEATYYYHENGSGGGLSSVDWNQTEGLPGYIYNRPFYKRHEPIIVPAPYELKRVWVGQLERFKATIEAASDTLNIEVGEKYGVYWDGRIWILVAQQGEEGVILGTTSILTSNEDVPEEEPPFVGVHRQGTNYIEFYALKTGGFYIGLLEGEETIKKIDSAFLPDVFGGADWNATSEEQEGFIKNKPSNDSFVFQEDLEDYATVSALDGVRDDVDTNSSDISSIRVDIENLDGNIDDLSEDLTTHKTDAEEKFGNIDEQFVAVHKKFEDTQADWNAYPSKDNLASILNRPFGDIPDLFNGEVVPVWNGSTYSYETGIELDTSIKYTVKINDTIKLDSVYPNSTATSGERLTPEGTVYLYSKPTGTAVLVLQKANNVEKLDIKYLPVDAILEQVPQSDWKIEYEKSTAFIKNKPFYTIDNAHIFTELTEFEQSKFNTSYYQSVNPVISLPLETTEEYIVAWDGKLYRGRPREVKIKTDIHGTKTLGCVLGNSALWAFADGNKYLTIVSDGVVSDQKTWPFVIWFAFKSSYTSSYPFDYLVTTQEGPHTIEVFKDIKKIESFYLPEEALRQPVQSDWKETDPASFAYIRNKPSNITQIPADWNQTNINAVDYIKNKPFGYENDLISQKQISFSYNEESKNYCAEINHDLDLRDYDDTTFTVFFDGTTYASKSVSVKWKRKGTNGTNMGDYKVCRVFGNTNIMPADPDIFELDTSYSSTNPFPSANFLLIQEYASGAPDFVLYSNDDNLTHSFGLRFNIRPTKRLDKQWLPTDTVYTSQLTWSNIKNTPFIPDAQIQADWNQTNRYELDYIKNKPELYNPPASTINGAVLTNVANSSGTSYSWQAEVLPQADWSERDYTLNTYIRNKPFGTIVDVLFEGEFTLQQLSGDRAYIGMVNSHYLPEVWPGEKYLVNGKSMEALELPQDFEPKKLTPFYFGNPRLLEEIYASLNQNHEYQLEDNGTDFFLGPWRLGTNVMMYITKKAVESVSVKISPVEKIRKLPVEQMPDEVFDANLQIEYDPTLTEYKKAAEAKPTGDRIRALEAYIEIIQQQGEIIKQLQNNIQTLTWRVTQLEKGNVAPPASVEDEDLIIEGSVNDEELELSFGYVENDTLIIQGSNTAANVSNGQLELNGVVEENETLETTGTVTVVDEIWEV